MSATKFSFEGKTYVVSSKALDEGFPIELPDGRVLVVTEWLLSRPIEPDNTTRVMKPSISSGNGMSRDCLTPSILSSSPLRCCDWTTGRRLIVQRGTGTRP